MTPDNASIISQIKSLEAQLGALKARLLKSASQNGESHPFADLCGRLAGQANSSEDEIDAVLYKLPRDFEETG